MRTPISSADSRKRPPAMNAPQDGRASYLREFEENARQYTKRGVAHAQQFMDRMSAEDTTQEALYRTYRRLSTGNEVVTNVGGLFFKILMDSVVDHRRRATRAQETLTNSKLIMDMEERIRNQTDTQRAAELTFSAEDLPPEVAKLSPRARQLVWAKYLDHLTEPEIAEKLGISHGNVRVRLSRVYDLLRPLLAGREGKSRKGRAREGGTQR